MKPTLLLYGNCQAAALCVIFAADPVVTAHFRVLHVPSFDDRLPDGQRVDEDAIRATAVFFDQHDRAPFPQSELLPETCLRISFPSIDLNLLWPFHCINPYNDEPAPNRLWGSFPYGDRVIVDAITRGISAEETLQTYLASSTDHLPNLSRFEKIEFGRLRARDAKCDVKFAEWVFAAFRTQNLFWCVNHPTMPALAELTHRLIAYVGDRSEALASAPIDATIAGLHPDGPLNFIRVPVHPTIAQAFELTWYPNDGDAHYGLREHRLSYEKYFAEMAEGSARVRDAAALVGSGVPE